MSKNTNNHTKSYFTADGTLQPGAETQAEREKRKLAQPKKPVRKEGKAAPNENPEIARAMGRKPGGGK
jgi:hypothetical protein